MFISQSTSFLSYGFAIDALRRKSFMSRLQRYFPKLFYINFTLLYFTFNFNPFVGPFAIRVRGTQFQFCPYKKLDFPVPFTELAILSPLICVAAPKSYHKFASGLVCLFYFISLFCFDCAQITCFCNYGSRMSINI